jgi:hypothetical protein
MDPRMALAGQLDLATLFIERTAAAFTERATRRSEITRRNV